jgi:hypothetical protein
MTDGPRVMLAIGGDVSLSRGVPTDEPRQGPGWLFAGIAPALAKADLLTFNWESPVLPEGQKPPEKGLVVPTEMALGAMVGIPPCAVTLANNHALDAGADGVRSTLSSLTQAGALSFGAGETQAEAEALRTVDVNGLRIGFLGRAEECPQLADKGFPGPALIRYPDIVLDVQAAAAACDCLIVHLHHGIEFVDWPAPHFVNLCHELAEAGARVVVGGHSHVPQGHEPRGRGHIFYCLGNLAFHIRKNGYLDRGSPWTRKSVLALIPIDRESTGEPLFVPYRIDAMGRPRPLAGEAAVAVQDHLASVSADLADDTAMHRHWRDSAMRYLGIYLDWASGTRDERGFATEETLRFFDRLAMNESRMWVRELFGQADWVRRMMAPPWR